MDRPVAVVTGASRGLGRGIARALGGSNFVVYLTGRDLNALTSAAKEVTAAGGHGIAIQCDHGDDEHVRAAFERVREESGRLDILVNNAAAVDAKNLTTTGGFWQKPLALADMMDVGLRSHYVAAYHAVPLMINTGGALIAQISFYGAVSYHCGPAYGAAKAGTDKMSFDMAAELSAVDVAAVSIWPGLVLTDELKSIPEQHLSASARASFAQFERPEFTGLIIERVWRDPGRMALSGATLIAAELGKRYGVEDIDGKAPISYAESKGSPSNRFLANPKTVG
ncbi:MAG TPA: SDR family NAD(P)-dependent oxidoreductase [Duganella sp.]|nr:SDR family NAD(P)-dependent oxidoreductase [Duganella sp.]